MIISISILTHDAVISQGVSVLPLSLLLKPFKIGLRMLLIQIIMSLFVFLNYLLGQAHFFKFTGRNKSMGINCLALVPDLPPIFFAIEGVVGYLAEPFLTILLQLNCAIQDGWTDYHFNHVDFL